MDGQCWTLNENEETIGTNEVHRPEQKITKKPSCYYLLYHYSLGVGVSVLDDGHDLAAGVDGPHLLLGAVAVLLGVVVVPEQVHVLRDQHPGGDASHVQTVEEILEGN